MPLHHDEGVNGNFLVSLVRDGTYIYDPNNYHGPTLYYFSAIFCWLRGFLAEKRARDIYGLTTFNIRFVTAAFGIATIGLALLLRKRLGTIGALSAAAVNCDFSGRGLPVSLLHSRIAVCVFHAGHCRRRSEVLRNRRGRLFDPGGDIGRVDDGHERDLDH